MKVLLVNPPSSNQDYLEPGEEKGFYKHVPLGLLYIAAVLEQDGHTVECIDVAAGRERETTVIQTHADVVGFTVTTLSYHNAVSLAQKIKARSPQTIIIFGGSHPTFMAEETLSTGAVDIVVRREGEITIQELLNCLSRNGNLQTVKGITYKGETIKSTPDRPFITDLDVLPFPARHLLTSEEYAQFGSISTGRGCPYQCIFCAAGPLSGYTYRMHSVERVLAEIVACHEDFGISDFIFLDDTFTAATDRVKALCTAFTDLDFPITWWCEARVNTVNKQILELMASSGCECIQFGVESGSDFILRSIRKGITTAMIKKAVEASLSAGIKVAPSFIIGHPEDTVETVRQTIAFAHALKSMDPQKVELTFTLLVPYPGTQVQEHAEELGITILTTDWSRYNFLIPVIETKNLTRQMLQNLLFTANLGGGLLRPSDHQPLFTGGDMYGPE
jgi:radical SAM superfamily enzyme YgiQ (UPF0313 family)